MPRDPHVLARELLGDAPDAIEPLVVGSERATHRVTVGTHRFVVKTDDDHTTVAREAAGQHRAAAAGVRVPEVIGVGADAFAMRWVDGVTLDRHPTAAAWADAGAQLRIAHDLGAAPPFGAGFGGYERAHASWREFFEVFSDREISACERELGFPAGDADRIRAAVHAAAGMLEAPHVAWCHGDFQPEHVLVDPASGGVAAIIDWADHGAGDRGWDVMVLTLDDDAYLDAFLTGYQADADLRAALAEVLPLYRVVRLLSEAHWLARHGYPTAANLRRATTWRA